MTGLTLRTGQRCPDCFHPWFSHPTAREAQLTDTKFVQFCSGSAVLPGDECRCQNVRAAS